MYNYCDSNGDIKHRKKTEDFISDFVKVKKNDNWIYVDNYGKEVIMPIEKNASYYYEGIATVRVKIN